MAELKQFIRERGSIKSKLTNFCNFVNEFELKLSSAQAPDEALYIVLDERSSKISDILHDFENIQAKLDILVEEIELPNHNEYRTSFENSYFNSIAKAKRLLKCSPYTSEFAPASIVPGSISAHSSVHENHGSIDRIRLPRLNIPQFDGTYSKWLEFYDLFNTNVHSKLQLSEIEKFSYLRGLLKGEAALLIQGYQTSAANYNAAWEQLQKRYHNTRLLINNHIKGIVEFPKITKESYQYLRQLHDEMQNHIRALQCLNEPVDSWNSLTIYLIAEKFDINTRKEWELEISKQKENPILTEMFDFLERRCQFLEKIDKSKTSNQSSTSQSFNSNRTKPQMSYVTMDKGNCAFCSEKHAVYTCKSFLELSVKDRYDEARKSKLCLNCLKPGHMVNTCKRGSCIKCKKRHNTLLHFETKSNASDSQQTVALSSQGRVITHGVIATAVINVFDNENSPREVTVFLDSASQGNYMTWDLAKALKLKSRKIHLPIVGIGKAVTESKGMVYATISSRTSDFSENLSFALLNEISGSMPSVSIDIDAVKVPQNITLADPRFHTPKRIDLSIGIDIFWKIICPSEIEHPFLFNTKFGYVVSGNVPCVKPSRISQSHITISDLSRQLQQFWEVENCPQTKRATDEENLCEEHFVKSYQRAPDGRFVVSIPLRDSPELLGESHSLAEKRLVSMEKRFCTNIALKTAYINFINEYKDLGHMQEIQNPNNSQTCFYLPHHGVIKQDSISTKLRVVFDGSALTSTGTSLNDLQLVGPTIQPDLFTILIRFRKSKYVISGDITKMYRQVLVKPEERSLQRILWRDNPNDPIKTFELCTVTYGTASASFLAIRCLFELAKECENTMPHVAYTIRNCMYVDDLLCSIDSIEEAIALCKDLIKVLESGGFPLRKWISNDIHILEGINSIDTNSDDVLKFAPPENTKTLGLSWSSKLDQLMYKVDNSQPREATKRSLYSIIPQLFDPLGLLAPCIIQAKILLQQLWSEKLEWDEALSGDLLRSWEEFYSSLHLVNDIRINRFISCENPVSVQINGFSDASSVAYGASIYMRTVDSHANVHVNLICAKSRVAPLKQISIPRLELLAAQMLAILMQKVSMALNLKSDQLLYWTDSTIVLGWLKRQPNTLDTFVGNRVSEIQSISNISSWHHVPSEQNPSDLVSRGLSPAKLQSSTLWWGGPAFLSELEIKWPSRISIEETVPNVPCQVSLVAKCKPPVPSDFLQIPNYSNLTILERTIAWCLRFSRNCRMQLENRRLNKSLTLSEVREARMKLISFVQQEHYSDELECLRNGKSISKSSKILSLNPFIHNDGILRVGGRIKHSDIPFQSKFPIILPPKCHLSTLIFRREHLFLLHTGPQSLFHSVRQIYWPVAGRSLAKQIVHNCVTCRKTKPLSLQPFMGDLPKDRVIPSPAFQYTGTDYAGPFLTRDHSGRRQRTTKCWICLFVCLSTKAVHLELVSSLSTDAFILTLRRFAARRGMPVKIMSDNGKNYQGASVELNELAKFLESNETEIQNKLVANNFNWCFIPAYTPHFGGVWEAGIRSMKYHLRRTMQNSCLTFEHLSTLLAQIEAILNSRPLTILPSHPNDLEPLTPGHFLIGQPMTTVPDPDLSQISKGKLDQFQEIQAMRQVFWKRWQQEYLPDLQTRMKWKESGCPLKIGDVVIIRDNNLPPMKWTLGRVSEVHQGADRISRVATVQTSRGLVKRGIVNLCPLPVV